MSVPSVPEFVNRMVSSEGMRSQRSFASRTCTSVGVLKAVPLRVCSPSASMTIGLAWPDDEGGGVQHEVEVAVAVDVVDVVPVPALREEGVRGEVRGAARAAPGRTRSASAWSARDLGVFATYRSISRSRAAEVIPLSSGRQGVAARLGRRARVESIPRGWPGRKSPGAGRSPFTARATPGMLEGAWTSGSGARSSASARSTSRRPGGRPAARGASRCGSTTSTAASTSPARRGAGTGTRTFAPIRSSPST